jgi:cell division protein FtsL
MNDRDLRFRRRIDQLLDRVEERDAMIDDLTLRLEELTRRFRRRGKRIYEITKSRDTWRHRWRVK